MLTKYITLLQGQDDDLSPTDLADIVWLAQQWARLAPPPEPEPVLEALPEPTPSLPPPSILQKMWQWLQSWLGNESTPALPPPAPVRADPLTVADRPKADPAPMVEPTAKLVAQVEANKPMVPFRTPTPPALPDSLNLMRALRPLKRRVSTRQATQLDEVATINQIVATGLWWPIVRPAQERWLEVALVIDESPSMVVWQRTVSQLQRLLEEVGAFRRVQPYSLRVDSNGELQLRPRTPNGTPLAPQTLLDPRGRRLIIIVSDLLAPFWYEPHIAAWLALWGRKGMVTLWHMLPPPLWSRSRLGSLAKLYLQLPAPLAPNQQLQRQPLRPGLPQPSGLGLPTLSVEAEAIKSWAKAIMGTPRLWLTGVVWVADKAQPLPPPDNRPVEAQLELFWQTASPGARQLLVYLAVVPLTLPIMRLVQQAMTGATPPLPLAEILQSRLLTRLTPLEATLHPDQVQFEFIGGQATRDLICQSLTRSRTVEVLTAVSRYLNPRLNSPHEFLAWLQLPETAAALQSQAEGLAFAEITAQSLRRLGGHYAAVAERLESAVQIQQVIPPRPKLTGEWCEVLAGEFIMGSDDHDDNEKPRHVLNLPYSYQVAKYPVTNVEYAQFVQAGGYSRREYWTKAGWQEKEKQKWVKPRYQDDARFNQPNQPVVGVSWYEAVAYCRWLTEEKRQRGELTAGWLIRLPTEAEWEKAARGTDGRKYPWGNQEPTKELANYGSNVAATTAVENYPQGASPYGCLDMAGNVWEWCATKNETDYKRYPYKIEDEWTEGYLARNNYRILRSGSWYGGTDFLRCAYRFNLSPYNFSGSWGFRCFVVPISNTVSLDLGKVEALDSVSQMQQSEEGKSEDLDSVGQIQQKAQPADLGQQQLTDIINGEIRVRVLTLEGDIIELPQGSTPLDFAYYAIDTEVAHRCRGAKINGKAVLLDYILKNGDQIEPLTSKQGGPRDYWLDADRGFIKTPFARSKVQEWFKEHPQEGNITRRNFIRESELSLPKIKIRVEWCEVPAGEFIMGDDNNDNEKPRHVLNLPYSYQVAKYPVTNAEYTQFVQAGGYNRREYWTEAGWQKKEKSGWTKSRYFDNSKFNQPYQPVVGVSWYEAVAYCHWLTEASELPAGWLIRLPTEAEWEKAARGTDGRKYPWGNQEPTQGLANYNHNVKTTTPVGRYPANFYGCHDMAGNVWEWCATRYDNGYKSYPYQIEDEWSEIYLEMEYNRIFRGGAFNNISSFLRAACRSYDGPNYWYYLIGFRFFLVPR